MAWLEWFWLRVLERREYLFNRNFLFCRTIFVPLHRLLRRFASYRYVAALALGPDDDMWNDVGIPCVASKWRDGSIDFVNPTHLSDKMRTEQLGKVFGTFEGRTPVMMVSSHGMIESMLKNTECFRHRRVFLCRDRMHDNMLPIIEGTRWRNIRSLVMTRFSLPAEIKRTIPVIVECAAICIENMQMMAEDGLVRSSRKTFGAFTMDLMGRMMFGRPFENYQNPDNEFARNAVNILIEGREEILLNTVRYPEFSRKPQCCPFDPEAMDFFKQYTSRFLQQRTEYGMDIIQTLENAKTSGRITVDEMYANCTILIALSYHSVSFVMAVACWEISRNEQIQERVIAEVDACLIKYGSITNEVVNELTYLDQVIKEALRKYPPAVRVERVCYRNTEICGIPVKRGTVVAIPLFTLHRDPETYKEPMEFNPDRFAGEKSESYGYGYLPFGESHRKCIAWKFAVVEMKVFLAYLFSQVRLSASDDEEPLVFQSKKNILVAEKISFKVQKRKDKVQASEY